MFDFPSKYIFSFNHSFLPFRYLIYILYPRLITRLPWNRTLGPTSDKCQEPAVCEILLFGQLPWSDFDCDLFGSRVLTQPTVGKDLARPGWAGRIQCMGANLCAVQECFQWGEIHHQRSIYRLYKTWRKRSSTPLAPCYRNKTKESKHVATNTWIIFLVP